MAARLFAAIVAIGTLFPTAACLADFRVCNKTK
jgi:hypothetical protein